MAHDRRTTTTAPEPATGYELTVLERGGVATRALPAAGTLTLGRAEDTDVRLVGPRVSRRHAVLHIDVDGFSLEDLGSSNGTVVNRQRLPARRRSAIAAGDSIQIGDFVLVIHPVYTEPDPIDLPMTARSPGFAAALEQIALAASADINVLLLGETGVGKDVLARRLHQLSPRCGRRFVRINCAALTDSLLESELFGHERGAFSGAVQAKPGLLESAAGGTVFLDEIGELPEALQPKVLHAVENREVTRVGSVQSRMIDIRVVAATNRDLAAEVTAKRFRSDLYYRLSTFSVHVPPLRERVEDIAALANELLRQSAEKTRQPPPQIDDAALAILTAYHWPGNVRELRNVLERAMVLGRGRTISVDLLPAALAGARPAGRVAEQVGAEPDPLRLSAQERDERRRIIDALVKCHGNQSEAARVLGMSRTTFLHRLDLYRISRPRKRPTAPV